MTKIIRDGMGNIISSSVMVFFWGLGIFFLYFQMSNLPFWKFEFLHFKSKKCQIWAKPVLKPEFSIRSFLTWQIFSFKNFFWLLIIHDTAQTNSTQIFKENLKIEPLKIITNYSKRILGGALRYTQKPLRKHKGILGNLKIFKNNLKDLVKTVKYIFFDEKKEKYI